MSSECFTCDKCLKTFNKGWSDEEAAIEYQSAPWNIPGEKHGILCDDCFLKFKIWFDSLTEDEHKRIRNWKV